MTLKGKLIAVLNSGSGGCDETSEGRIGAILEASGRKAEILEVEPAGVEAALEDAVARADVLIVLGGDGTIRSAAELCGAAKKPLIPLPGGTMNMLPKALYGDVGWEAALAATLAAPQLHDVSGGVDAREAIRAGHPGEAVERAVNAIRHHAETVGYQMGHGPRRRAEAVAVICPLISRAMEEGERALEAAVLDRATAVAMFRLAFLAIFSDWREDSSVVLFRVQRLKVTSRSRVPAILDGEKVLLGRSVDIVFRPLAFQAVVPAKT